jgi:hypothetical protein
LRSRWCPAEERVNLGEEGRERNVRGTHLFSTFRQRLLIRPLHHVNRIHLIVPHEQLILDVLIPRKLKRTVYKRGRVSTHTKRQMEEGRAKRTMHELPRPPRRVRSRMSTPPPYSIRNAQRVAPQKVTVLPNSHTQRVLQFLLLQLCLSLALLVRTVPAP